MDKDNRLKLGIVLNYKPSWLGGIYYILNIVKSIQFLDEKDRPEVFLFYNPSLSKFVQGLDYPYLKTIPWQFKNVPATFLHSILRLRNESVFKIQKEYALDAIFPARDLLFKPHRRIFERPLLVSWYADLQHKFYPDFFQRKELFFREIRTRLMLRNTDKLLLSSHDTESHFRKFYKPREDLKIEVYHFVSIIDDFDFSPIGDLQRKYNVPSDYFMVSNQFLLHKNHMVVLKALAHLKETGRQAHVVITGNMQSKRFPAFINELKDFIATNKLESNLSLVGVIPRQDQLSLMRHARAIIQPSLFEGWSTVIEDARSLQVPVIASDLPVNIEQLGNKARYFSPHDYKTLATLLSDTPERNEAQLIYEPYETRMREAARTFINIFKTTA